MRLQLITTAAALTLVGCMTTKEQSSAARATALLADAHGGAHGNVAFAEDSTGLVVQVAAEGLPPGVHGIHLHSVGRCDPPDFQSAGPHWNPGMKQHGRDNPQGAHQGDLPNIEVGADGRGSLRFTVPMATLAELLDSDGAAIVVHASADDYRTDPSGNSGARIACGVISR